MKIFISWSGPRSKALAEALREWLPLVLHYAEPWLSESDIEAGERWGDAVAKQLDTSSFGIICVTRENAQMPWVLFEAGALAKSLQDAKVIPLLLDLDFRDITGPLAQFQAKKVDKSGLDEVVRSVNRSSPSPEPDDRTKSLFEALWPKLESQVEAIPDEESSAKRTRPQSEVLEELVGSVRSVESRLRDVAEESPRPLARHGRRMRPRMFEEFMYLAADGPGDPLPMLIALGMFREDMPWLYELGVEAYRASIDGSSTQFDRAMGRLVRVVELTSVHFRGEEFGLFDSRELHMLMETVHRFSTSARPMRRPQRKSGTAAPKE